MSADPIPRISMPPPLSGEVAYGEPYIDLSLWPIVVMVMSAPPTVDGVHAMYDASDRVLDAGEAPRAAAQPERRQPVGVFPPAPRRHAAMRERAQRERAADLVRCDVRVVPNTLVRNALNAFERLTSVQTYRTANVPTFGAALVTIEELSGLTPGCTPLPPGLEDLVRYPADISSVRPLE